MKKIKRFPCSKYLFPLIFLALLWWSSLFFKVYIKYCMTLVLNKKNCYKEIRHDFLINKYFPRFSIITILSLISTLKPFKGCCCKLKQDVAEVNLYNKPKRTNWWKLVELILFVMCNWIYISFYCWRGKNDWNMRHMWRTKNWIYFPLTNASKCTEIFGFEWKKFANWRVNTEWIIFIKCILFRDFFWLLSRNRMMIKWVSTMHKYILKIHTFDG